MRDRERGERERERGRRNAPPEGKWTTLFHSYIYCQAIGRGNLKRERERERERERDLTDGQRGSERRE